MDEGDSLDFKALRAKFQEEEELLLKLPLKSKPALPEKPKVVPPPQSPTNYMPAGARPSLLSTINQSLEGKTTVAPRVVFKDEKKESKKPLLPSNSKLSKIKVSKDKGSKGGRERLYDEDVPPQKTKKEKKKEATAELVPATPPPKNSTLKKKGFLFKKSKRDSLEITADPIMDSPSSEVVGPIPLIPVPEDITGSPTEASTPKALIPTSGPTAVTLPLTISTSSDLTPAPAFSTEALSVPLAPTPESETTAPIDTPHLAQPPSLNDLPPVLAPLLIIPDPEVTVPTPTNSNPSPEPELSIEHLNLDIPSPSVDVDSISASPKLERPLSALSALSVLERAEEMSPGKRTPPGDSRIFNALEKARKMANHHKPASPLLMSPSAEDEPVLFDLPPIDYEGKMGQDLPPKPEMNGLDHRSSLVLKELTEDDFLDPSEVPPPPPRRPLSEFEIAAPLKPERPPSVDLSAFSPPPLEDSALAIPAPAEFFSQSDSGAQLEFGDVTPKANSPELPVSDWGSADNDGSGTITEDGPYLPNGTVPTGEVQATTPELHDSPEDSLILTPGSHGDDNPYEHADSVYENLSTISKKKGKGDVKKRKGQPKNPYAETQEKTEEKTKTGRFGKSDKKAVAEGPDEKELKKKEKQRMEKEKKEQKERQEREKKEQKEREKRENELKKKFKITGQEDAMYQAKVTVTTKGRKQDLPVKSGDTISIIRTTNCPKGKWLARDSSNNYGYVAVDHVDLDIKEMLELGKRAAVSRLNSTSVEPEVPSAGAPNHYPNESFTDDSEEWTCDDDEPLSPTEHVDAQLPVVHSRAHSLPVMGDTGSEVLSINHQHSHSDLAEGPNQQARHEALQKLATFFHPVKTTECPASPIEPESSPEVIIEEESVPESSPPQEQEFEIPIIPPPEQYADFQTE